MARRESAAARGRAPRDGAAGWDEYASFYDWENARTIQYSGTLALA